MYFLYLGIILVVFVDKAGSVKQITVPAHSDSGLPESSACSMMTKPIQQKRAQKTKENIPRGNSEELMRQILLSWSKSGRKFSPFLPLVDLELVPAGELKKLLMWLLIKRSLMKSINWKFYGRKAIDESMMRLMKRGFAFVAGYKKIQKDLRKPTMTDMTDMAKRWKSREAKQRFTEIDEASSTETAMKGRHETKLDSEKDSRGEKEARIKERFTIRPRIKSLIDYRVMSLLRTEIRSWIWRRLSSNIESLIKTKLLF